MRTLRIEEITYKRLTSVLQDVMHYKKKDVNYDDLLNELIDVYQANVGGSIGGTIGGGRSIKLMARGIGSPTRQCYFRRYAGSKFYSRHEPRSSFY